jgi:tetratricopeptide (TPR) repeat protein
MWTMHNSKRHNSYIKEHTMKLILPLILLFSSGAMAQAKTTFGSDNATRCYQESNMPFGGGGLRYCTDAIRNDDLTIRDMAATYTNRGIILAANGEYERAMKDHNEAALLLPEMGKIYVNRGNVFHQQLQFERALQDYETALEVGGVAKDIVHYNRALSLIRLKRWDDAREALETALEINPDSSRVKRKLDQFNAPKERPSPAVVTPDDELN